MPRRLLLLLEVCLLLVTPGLGDWGSLLAEDRQSRVPVAERPSEAEPSSDPFAAFGVFSNSSKHSYDRIAAETDPTRRGGLENPTRRVRLPDPTGRVRLRGDVRQPAQLLEPLPRRVAPQQRLLAPQHRHAGRAPFRSRLPGEFERQGALLLGGREMLSEMPDVFADIVDATRNHVAVITMVNDAEEADMARTVLLRRAVQAQLHLVQVPHNTMWARDYGPVLVDAGGEPTIVDADYGQFDRPDDDEVPYALAQHLLTPVVKTPLMLEGGNLLSNGRGLFLTTTKLLEDNADVQDEQAVRDWMERMYGAAEMLFLEPLEGESTGHVDMFAAFTAPHVVVVASCDPQQDATNAAVLDRNAERLSQIRVKGRKLRVERIPMPPHDDGIWRTYTNVVFANGVLLVPVYPGHDEQGQLQAIQTYCRLLPGWRVVPVNANRLIECGGALHCVTMNLGPLHKVPVFPAPRPGNPRGPADFSDAVTGVAGNGQFAPLSPFDPLRDGRRTGLGLYVLRTRLPIAPGNLDPHALRRAR